MAKDQLDTEEQIFEAASRIFQQKGYAGARMQEIADEAEINKSMLHYYYRSKSKLFTKVYQRELARFFPALLEVMDSNEPLDQKISKLIDAYYSFLSNHPRLPQFIITEMNRNPEEFQEFINRETIRPPESFFKQIKKDIKENRIDDVDPRQLMVSIVGLTIFPFIASTMVKSIFNFDEKQYLQFLSDRKEFLVNFILNAINYRPS